MHFPSPYKFCDAYQELAESTINRERMDPLQGGGGCTVFP